MQGCTASLLTENDRVRVQRFDFEPGGETGVHTHGVDYVVVALTDCTMAVTDANGTREVNIPARSAYAGTAGTHHNVANGAAAPMSFVEIELK